MGSANDLILLFLGLETLSLALYVLAASDRERPTSQESGIKYFVLGGFASAFFLYGIALIYGGTQSTNIGEIIESFQTSVLLDGKDSIVLAGIALLIVGLGFKVAAVPFHVWTPDVYQGAPTNVTAFMASVGKAAAFAAMLRVLVIALPFHRDDWRPAIWVLAVLSLVIGSVLAIVQTDVKRMLAYSSISHAGFILVGVEAAGHDAGERVLGDGMPSVLTYLLFYSVLTIGSFAVVALVARNSGGDTSLDAFKGLAQRRPTLAVALTVFLLAQAGVPLTSGFVAKWGVIQAAVEQESYAIAIIAMVAAVVAAFLYLRIMVSTWLETGSESTEPESIPFSTGLAVFGGGRLHVVRRCVARLAARRSRQRHQLRPVDSSVDDGGVGNPGSERPVEGLPALLGRIDRGGDPAGVIVADRPWPRRLAVHLGDTFGHQVPAHRFVDTGADGEQAVIA